MKSFPSGGIAVVFGASGGLGRAFVSRLRAEGAFAQVLAFSRSGAPPTDITDDAAVAAALDRAAEAGPLRLIINACGFLHDARFSPEKSWRALDAAHMAQAFAVNAIGPALIFKHALPRLPREGKAVCVTLSAKVGSIGDNRLGGWHSYRASKAAQNQIVRTVSIELARTRPEAVVVALHPGTTDTALSAPFGKTGLTVRSPEESVVRLLSVIDGLSPLDNGAFLSHDGTPLPW